jgi:hypothetical protein
LKDIFTLRYVASGGPFFKKLLMVAEIINAGSVAMVVRNRHIISN